MWMCKHVFYFWGESYLLQNDPQPRRRSRPTEFIQSSLTDEETEAFARSQE